MLRPKLPRKRKKSCIKSLGRKFYYNTVNLAYATEESPCKFWKEVITECQYISGCPILIPTPKSYW